MAQITQLKRTPIKEIILIISFKETVELSDLEKFQELPEIKTLFSNIQKGFQTEVQNKTNETPIASVHNDGYILKSLEPHNKIIQTRRGSFALHKVTEYESFDNLLANLKTYWELLLTCTGNLTISNISTRYLNFIEKKEGENYDDLLKIQTVHPFGNDIDNSFNQLRFKYKKHPDIAVNLVTARAKSNNNSDGVILDVTLNRSITEKGNDAFECFKDMRSAKNELFFESITNLTINNLNE